MALILSLRDPGSAAGPFRFESGPVVIGRAADADVRLSHPLISSRHCIIMGQGASWQVQDASTNGTEVNGRRLVSQQPLQHGDVIVIASFELTISLDAGVAATKGAIPSPAGDSWGRMTTGASALSSWPADRAQKGTRAVEPPNRPAPGGATQEAGKAALQAALIGLTRLAQSRARARRDLKLADSGAATNPILAGDTAALNKLVTMPPETATEMVSEACRELEAHQRAGLAAMQSAFRAALDHFSPQAIKLRARDDASAWKSYEKAFNAQDGFIELFSQEFAKAYEQQARS